MYIFQAKWEKKLYTKDLQFIAVILENKEGAVLYRNDITREQNPEYFKSKITQIDIKLNAEQATLIIWPFYKDWGKKITEPIFPSSKKPYASIAFSTSYQNIPCKGIKYWGPKGTSGYALAAKHYMYDIVQRGIPLSWKQLEFDKSEVQETTSVDIVVNSKIDKHLSDGADLVILHCTPENWPHIVKEYAHEIPPGTRIVGQTVWETDKICDKWVECINTVDEVWVPCKWNAEVFQKSGVTIPIRIVPHVVEKLPLPETTGIKLTGKYFYTSSRVKNIARVPKDNHKVFYNISQWTPRKGMEDLLHAYCQAFTKQDNVLLILKTHGSNYSESEIEKIDKRIKDILSFYRNHPDVYFIEENLTQQQILALHKIGDCYVSLCKSEGWGLGAYEAMQYGKHVVITGYGGHMDYLTDYEKARFVKYQIVPCEGMEWIPWYNSDQNWAKPHIEDAIIQIKGIYS